jgi:hypothetical protein
MDSTNIEWEKIKGNLNRSKFRSQFRLDAPEKRYVKKKGFDLIRKHAVEFITTRLAPAFPPKDGKQTPMRDHPVFIAQHATATCCRRCLQKWHEIEYGKPLAHDEIDYIVSVIMCWIADQVDDDSNLPEIIEDRQTAQLSLF